MAFKMKGISSVSNIKPPASKSTPFYQQNDFSIIKDQTTGSNGNTVRALTREKIIPGKKGQEVEIIETDQKKYIDSFKPEYERLLAEGEFGGTIEEFIDMKSEKYQDKEDETVIEDRQITNIEGSEKIEEKTIERPETFFEGANTGFNWTGKISDLSSQEGGEAFYKYFDDMARDLTLSFADKEEFNRSGTIQFNNQAFQNGGLFDTRVGPGQSQHLVYKLMDIYRDNPGELEKFFRENGFIKEGGMIEEIVEVKGTNENNSTDDTGWITRTD